MTGKEIRSGTRKTALAQGVVEIPIKTNLVWQVVFGLLLPLQSVLFALYLRIANVLVMFPSLLFHYICNTKSSVSFIFQGLDEKDSSS